MSIIEKVRLAMIAAEKNIDSLDDEVRFIDLERVAAKAAIDTVIQELMDFMDSNYHDDQMDFIRRFVNEYNRELQEKEKEAFKEQCLKGRYDS